MSHVNILNFLYEYFYKNHNALKSKKEKLTGIHARAYVANKGLFAS